MLGIQKGTVDDLLPETVVQPLKSSSPRIVIVEEAFYLFIALQGFHRLLYVGDGSQSEAMMPICIAER